MVSAPEELGDYLAEAGEVEVDGDRFAFGGKDFDAGGIGGEGAGGEFQIDRATPWSAGARAPATIERAAS